MKKLFTAIRASDLEMVRQIIEKKPELVNCVAKQPPKKDDGQSPLQVALKTGNTAIANYLLDMGADVNFIEDETCCNEWRTPVLHDAINCAVMSCRWNIDDKHMGFKVFSTKEKAAEALISRGIRVVTHLILGLPGENQEMMLESVRKVCSLPIFGIKLHLMNIVKTSPLYRAMPEYVPFDSIEEYVDLTVRCLEIIPPGVTIHRLTGDVPRRILVSPEWSYRKRTILNMINSELKRRDTCQGAAL